MSNYNEYITKLDCASSMKRTIERMYNLMRMTEREYKNLIDCMHLPDYMKYLTSDGIKKVYENSTKKHEQRLRNKTIMSEITRFTEESDFIDEEDEEDTEEE